MSEQLTPLPSDFPLDLFLSKWDRRFEQQPDDWQAVPESWSGYAWDGIEANRISWAALKSAWRRMDPLICPGCNEPAILTNFGFPWRGQFNRYPNFRHVCGRCRRRVKDESVNNVAKWMVENLDADVWPPYDMLWDRKRKWEPPTKKT